MNKFSITQTKHSCQMWEYFFSDRDRERCEINGIWNSNDGRNENKATESTLIRFHQDISFGFLYRDLIWFYLLFFYFVMLSLSRCVSGCSCIWCGSCCYYWIRYCCLFADTLVVIQFQKTGWIFFVVFWIERSVSYVDYAMIFSHFIGPQHF